MNVQFQILALLLVCGYVISQSCTTNPCRNGGTCRLTTYGLTACSCEDGFSGPICEINCSEKKTTCPTGFRMIPAGSGKCFHISPSLTGNFLKSQKYCRNLQLHSSLWEPKSRDDFMWVTTQAEITKSYWTGMFDGLRDKVAYLLGTGKPVDFVAPIGRGSFYCVNSRRIFLSTSYMHLEYAKCSVKKHAICELLNPCEIATVPVLPAPR